AAQLARRRPLRTRARQPWRRGGGVVSKALALDSAIRRYEGHDASLDPGLRRLEAGAGRGDLEPQAVHPAGGSAALARALTPEERYALIVLILVSLAALEQGSTRFPVTGPESTAPLTRLLGDLIGEVEPDGEVARIRDAIAALLASGRAQTLIARNEGEYKPLVYLPPFISQLRIHSAEEALAGRLAALMRVDPAICGTDGTRELDVALDDVLHRPPAR